MSRFVAFHGNFTTNFARAWKFSMQAGVAISEVQSPFSFTLSPILAALLGQKSISGVAYSKVAMPSGAVTLSRQFPRSALTFSYKRGVVSGNGFTNTARNETGLGSYSYSGIRRVSLSVDGGYYGVSGLGQSFGKYSQYSGGAAASFAVAPATHLTVRYDYRDQEIAQSTYGLQGSRVSVGIMFSPGNVPLSIW